MRVKSRLQPVPDGSSKFFGAAIDSNQSCNSGDLVRITDARRRRGGRQKSERQVRRTQSTFGNATHCCHQFFERPRLNQILVYACLRCSISIALVVGTCQQDKSDFLGPLMRFEPSDQIKSAHHRHVEIRDYDGGHFTDIECSLTPKVLLSFNPVLRPLQSWRRDEA